MRLVVMKTYSIDRSWDSGFTVHQQNCHNFQVESYTRTFSLEPAYTPGKHWVAVADITREQKTGHGQDKLMR